MIRWITFFIVFLCLTACHQESVPVNFSETAQPERAISLRDQIKSHLIEKVAEIRMLHEKALVDHERELVYYFSVNPDHANLISVNIRSMNGTSMEEEFQFAVRKDLSEILYEDPDSREQMTLEKWRIKRAEPTPSPEPVSTPRAMPQIMSLAFGPLELEDAVVAEQDEMDGKLIQKIPFGRFNGKSIEMKIYEANPAKGCMAIETKIYCMNDLTLKDPKHTRENGQYVPINQWMGTGAEGYYLLGGVEQVQNGPGFFVYFIYEAKTKKWKTYADYMEIQATDLNQDGTIDAVMQFPGMHLSRGDVFVLRNNHGVLEQSQSFQSLLSEANDGLKLIFGGQSFVASAKKEKAGYRFYFYANIDEMGRAQCDVFRFEGWQLIKLRSFVTE